MATATMEPHLVESLQQAAQEILETMVCVSPDRIEQVPETTSTFTAEVVGLLGFTGTRTGNFVVRAPERLARAMVARMLMTEPGQLGDFAAAADGFGELVNMLSGNFKNAWVAQGNRMDLSVPNVIHRGTVHVDTEHAGAQRTCVRVTIGGDALDIGVHFEADGAE
ncbi:MAG: chemotaxis protein CheX [Planctomycetes bacterium]|nr:chemotaxis protein CheX [Planctomycetota bacterium]